MLTRGRLSKSTSDCDQGAFENAIIREGPDYQVSLPVCNSTPLRNGDNQSPSTPKSRKRRQDNTSTRVFADTEREISLWRPMPNKDQDKLDKFLVISKEFSYGEEQALALLSWHSKNIDHAQDDLGNFSPLSDNWSHREKKKFFMAVRTQKKEFNRIKHMFPQRTMRELVNFYYLNKKKRSVLQSLGLYDPGRCGLVQSVWPPSNDPCGDKNLHASGLKDNGKERDELQAEFDRHMRQISGGSTGGGEVRGVRGGGNRDASDEDAWSNVSDIIDEPTDKYALPPGIHYQHSDFVQLAQFSEEDLLRRFDDYDRRIIDARQRVSKLQEEVDSKDASVMSGLNNFKPIDGLLKPTYRWTNEELLFTVQAVRKHGRDYRAIADLVGSKTEAMIRSFFNLFTRRFHLDELVAEFDREKKLHSTTVNGSIEVVSGRPSK